MRRHLLTSLVFISFYTSCTKERASLRGTEETHAYNVFLLTVDTLRADHMGCYGYQRNTTPFLDELAQQSTLFEWALVQWPKTGPSFASLFSSTYGSTSGVARKTGKFVIPPAFDLLAEILQEAGFETMAAVSNGSLSKELGYGQGFDRYEHLLSTATDSGERVADLCRKVLRKRTKNGNYFLWAHFIDPHTPYHAPKEYEEMFAGDDLYGRTEGPAVLAHSESTKGPESVGLIPPAALIQGKDRVRDYVLAYDAEIRHFDDIVRELLDWMKEKQLLENTIVVFTSDHGESLGDHNYFFEHGRYPYDACTRVPLFIHHPDAEPSTIEAPVALLDVVPTLLEVLSLPPGLQTEGKSLLPWIIAGKPGPDIRPVITESGYKEEYCIAIRFGPFKLIKVSDPQLRKELTGEEYELYNVLEDPGETRNLIHSTDEAVRSVLARLKPVLDREAAERYAGKGMAHVGSLSEEVRKNLEELGYTEEGH